MEFIKKIGKSENGSVTVYVLSTLIVVLLVTTTIYIGLRNKTTTQIKQMDKINKEYSVTDTDMQEAYNNTITGTLESVKGTEATNTTVKDNLGNKVVVPAGFIVINPNDDVTDGIVIEDVSHSATAGSQFVWIPVGEVVKDSEGNKETITLGRYVFNEDGTINTELSKMEPEDELKAASSSAYNFIEGLKDNTTINVHAKNIETFRTNVTNNHGYYIGRYEARKNGTQLTIRANDTVYNNITQADAATLSRKMYSDSNFESDLGNSYAWDTAILFLQKFDNRANKTKAYSRQNSLNTSLANQGTNNLTDTSKQDVICNIWDMASNDMEWTTETFSREDACTLRGGVYDNQNYYAWYRGPEKPNNTYSSYCFRVILYM